MQRVLMICDLQSQISTEYVKHATKSFEAVNDVIEIEPYQFFTPKNPSNSFEFNTSKQRTPTEIAILETYHSLMRLLADGEKFIIMEHDAYLRDEETFRKHLSDIEEYDIWNVGIAVECHTLKPEFAAQWCKNLEDDFTSNSKGPMSLMLKMQHQKNVLYTTDGQEGLMCKAKTTGNAARGKGQIFKAPVTQCYISRIGLTNIGRVHNGYTSVTQPQMVFLD